MQSEMVLSAVHRRRQRVRRSCSTSTMRNYVVLPINLHLNIGCDLEFAHSPWFDSDYRAIRRNCRRLERTYRRTKNDDDRVAWTKAVRQKHLDFNAKKNTYWTTRILSESGIPAKLWRSTAKILGRDKNISKSPPTHTADDFLEYFKNKVQSVRSSTDGYPSPVIQSSTDASFKQLLACTENDVRDVIMNSPSKQCSLDPIPTSMVKGCIDVLLPYLTAMCSASLAEGYLPVSQRHAVVTPLLKKHISM